MKCDLCPNELPKDFIVVLKQKFSEFEKLFAMRKEGEKLPILHICDQCDKELDLYLKCSTVKI